MTAIARTIAADVCYYGNRERGFYYLSNTASGARFGRVYSTDEAFPFDTLTEAKYVAQDELRDNGIGATELVAHFAPGGEVVAYDEAGSCRNWGHLTFVGAGPAAVFDVPTAEVSR